MSKSETEWYCRGCGSGRDGRDCSDACGCACHGNTTTKPEGTLRQALEQALSGWDDATMAPSLEFHKGCLFAVERIRRDTALFTAPPESGVREALEKACEWEHGCDRPSPPWLEQARAALQKGQDDE